MQLPRQPRPGAGQEGCPRLLCSRQLISTLCVHDLSRPAGFSDASLAYLLHKLATYPLPPDVGEPNAWAHAHGGCRTTLECLKLGPPADQQHFSGQAGKQCTGPCMHGHLGAHCNLQRWPSRPPLLLPIAPYKA